MISSQAWWHVSGILALRRLRQDAYSLSYIACLKTNW